MFLMCLMGMVEEARVELGGRADQGRQKTTVSYVRCTKRMIHRGK